MHNPTRGRQYRRPCTNFPTTHGMQRQTSTSITYCVRHHRRHIPARPSEFLLKHHRSAYAELLSARRSGAPGQDDMICGCSDVVDRSGPPNSPRAGLCQLHAGRPDSGTGQKLQQLPGSRQYESCLGLSTKVHFFSLRVKYYLFYFFYLPPSFHSSPPTHHRSRKSPVGHGRVSYPLRPVPSPPAVGRFSLLPDVHSTCWSSGPGNVCQLINLAR